MAKGTAVVKAKLNLPGNLSDKLQEQMKDLQNRVAPSGGNKIRCTKQKTFKLPNGTELETLEAIVVDFSARNEYYEGAFDPNEIALPNCFAVGLEPATLVPSKKVVSPQGDSCATCSMAQWGSANNGKGKGKACKNMRILALLPPDADAETPLMIVKVSPTALKAFDAHVINVARANNLPVLSVVTELSFDPGTDYVSLRFKALDNCTKEQLSLALNRADEARQLVLAEPDAAEEEAPKVKAKAKVRGAR